MFSKLFELSFRDLLLFLKFLLKDVLHQLRKEGSYNVSRNVLHLVEMENLFGLLL
jgi:hypothetical protein